METSGTCLRSLGFQWGISVVSVGFQRGISGVSIRMSMAISISEANVRFAQPSHVEAEEVATSCWS